MDLNGSIVDQMIQQNKPANWKTEKQKSLQLNRKKKKYIYVHIFRNEASLSNFWATSNVLTFALQGHQKEKRQKETENLVVEIIAESISDLGKGTDIYSQESGSPKKDQLKETSHTVMKNGRKEDK